MPLEPGEVVIASFPGAQATKIRPAVVLSSERYHAQRPDVILGVLATRNTAMPDATDYDIVDWRQANLRSPSRFRLYVVTLEQTQVRAVGALTPGDWQAVVARMRIGFGGL